MNQIRVLQSVKMLNYIFSWKTIRAQNPKIDFVVSTTTIRNPKVKCHIADKKLSLHLNMQARAQKRTSIESNVSTNFHMNFELCACS